MYNKVSESYNERCKNYYNKYNELSEVKKDKLDRKLKPTSLT